MFSTVENLRNRNSEDTFITSDSPYQIHLENNEMVFYDAKKSILYNSKGIKITPFTEDESTKMAKPTFKEAVVFSPEKPVAKSREVRKLKISMGLACNYSCGYCSQSSARSSMQKSTLPKPEEFLEKIFTSFHFRNDGEHLKIEFWGGEPLLYWSFLKPTAELLKEKAPKARMSMITNGSLLTPEKVDWLDRMGFTVAISFDGEIKNSSRGKNPFSSDLTKSAIRDLAFRLGKERFSFNCVLTANNYSLKKIYTDIAEEVGFVGFMLNTEGLVSIYQESYKNLMFNEKGESSIVKTIADDITSAGFDGGPFIHYLPSVASLVSDFYSSLQWQRNTSQVGQKCGMDRAEDISVDLKGDVYTCQNTSGEKKHYLGNISKFESIKLNTSWHWQNHERCNHCAVVQICKGSCMYLDSEKRKPTCDGHFIFNTAIFSAAIYFMTGQKIKKIQGNRLRDKNVQEFAI